jgi:SP family facilitated glucose transporter-like MFS transporter 8
MIVIGSSVSFLIGSLISWKTLALTGLAPCIVLLFGLCFIPESPRWLAKAGHEKEFRVALQKLRGKDADITNEADGIQVSIQALEILPKARIQDLVSKKYGRSVIVSLTKKSKTYFINLLYIFDSLNSCVIECSSDWCFPDGIPTVCWNQWDRILRK